METDDRRSLWKADESSVPDAAAEVAESASAGWVVVDMRPESDPLSPGDGGVEVEADM